MAIDNARANRFRNLALFWHPCPTPKLGQLPNACAKAGHGLHEEVNTSPGRWHTMHRHHRSTGDKESKRQRKTVSEPQCRDRTPSFATLAQSSANLQTTTLSIQRCPILTYPRPTQQQQRRLAANNRCISLPQKSEASKPPCLTQRPNCSSRSGRMPHNVNCEDGKKMQRQQRNQLLKTKTKEAAVTKDAKQKT